MKRSIIFESMGTDFNKNLQDSIRQTLHLIDCYKPGYLTRKEYADWRNQILKKQPSTKSVFETVEKSFENTPEFPTDDIIIKFSRYGKTIYEEFVRLSLEDEVLMQKAENISRYLRNFEETQSSGFRDDSSISIQVVRFEPDKIFYDKFANATENLKVKFMFENQIKDSERISKEANKIPKITLFNKK